MMDINAIKGVATAQGAATSALASAKGRGLDFAAALNSALQSVSQSQNDSVELQKQVQQENPNVSLEQTMVSLNVASLNFSEAVQVRNKLVQAYDQVMNMQV